MEGLPRPCRIVRLSSALIDQIAAGEVVERAASVVKELCENSLDAGARRIDVEVVGGGRTSIRIVDDGCGMTPEEARMALERHATSKISSESDLWGVETFGFRGEALASIASVSRLNLQTRSSESTEGFSLSVHAGVEIESRACGMPQGTQIEVKDLFFNTPARLKFQKTEATEAGNVSEALLRLAIANPDVHFRLRANGRLAMDLPPHRDLAERVRAALAKRGAGVLHEAVGDENGVSVHAFLAGPEFASTTSRNTFLFVGRRFVRDRSLLQAISMGYGEVVEKGKYPLAVLFVDVAGEEVDVNVHPQKLEVRFAQPQPVYAAVRHVLSRALVDAPWGQSLSSRSYSFPPGSHSKVGMRIADAANLDQANEEHVPVRRIVDQPYLNKSSDRDLDRVFVSPNVDAPAPPLVPPAIPLPVFPQVASPNLASLTFVGGLSRDYWMFEDAGTGLVLMDRRAARERLLFANLHGQFAKGKLSSQRLLFPVPVPLDESDMPTTPAAIAALERLGFETDAFGPKTLLVRSVPNLLAQVDTKPLLLTTLAALMTFQNGVGGSEDELQVLSKLAVLAGSVPDEVTNKAEVELILRRLAEADISFRAGLQRSLLLHISLTEVARRFGHS
jgi:DNA mismatch repair protein MutL